jgi:hypothetical protein
MLLILLQIHTTKRLSLSYLSPPPSHVLRSISGKTYYTLPGCGTSHSPICKLPVGWCSSNWAGCGAILLPQNSGGRLTTPLGNWCNITHQVWQWYYTKEDNDLQKIEGGKLAHFKPARGFQLTRSTITYQQVWDKQHNNQLPLGCPTSVRAISSTKVTKLQDGPSLVDASQKHNNCWEIICSWGGGWMWEDIDFAQETTQDLKWVAKGVKNNFLVWTTDGSYDRKRAADLSAVGWIIFCKRTGLRMTGTFWEKSPSASLFRAEMFGLCCLHLLARGVANFFDLGQWAAILSCNNKRALELSSNHCRRIKPSANTANIRHSFRATKQGYIGGFKYVHIWTHGPVFTMESTQSDAATKLRLRYTGKKALLSAIISGYHDRPTRILRCEDIALVIWGNKVTGDVSTPLRFHASKELATNYLRTCTRDKWPNKCFEEVDWEHLELALKNKPGMYKVWQSKQTSGFCGT